VWPLGGLPHGLLADPHVAPLDGVREPLLAREEARAATRGARSCYKSCCDLCEPRLFGDGSAAGDPRGAGIDVRDERVVVEPIAEIGFE
jgi:hypothetical protein